MSDQQNDSQEKSQEASPTRLDRARREGDVAQSKEINSAAGYLGLYLAIILASGGLVGLAGSLSALLSHPSAFVVEAFEASNGAFIRALFGDIAGHMTTFFLLPAMGALAALFAQQAITFAPSKIKPKFSRLSLVENAKKKYGPGGLVEFSKSSVKLLVVFTLFGLFFIERFANLPADARTPALLLPERLLAEAAVFLGVIVLFSVAIAAIDFPWSQHQHAKRLRMTHEEIKKESKENDGDPTLKQSRRERAQAIATNQMMLDVPKADVVIVNPTHYAVALKWARDDGMVPICVAKGADALAAHIRHIAAAAGVPIRSDPPSARAIYASVEVGEEIKREHFAAVAAAIHFADSMRIKAKERGERKT